MLPELNLQLITCSVHGDIRVWDLKADPMKMELKKQVQQFKTKERFGRPVSLDVGVSTFNKLNRRWKPDVTVSYQYVKASEEKLSIEAFHSFQDIKYNQEHKVYPFCLLLCFLFNCQHERSESFLVQFSDGEL